MNPGSAIQATLLVMAGGALGAAGRYQLGRIAFHLGLTGYPWATLSCNVLGGLAMGVLAGVLARSNVSDEGWRLFVGVGLLGGFTTFSSFSLEMVGMIERGALGVAFGYALFSVIAAVLALFIGLWLVRGLA